MERHGTAVVLGASMAGLLAARVLADHYTRVTLVERDRLPVRVENRRGVPQGRHVHGLLPSGSNIVGELFPGLLEDMVAAGGTKLSDYTRAHLQLDGVHRLSRDLVVEPLYQPSRPFLETAVRSRVRQLSNVDFRDGCAAVGLVTGGAGERVVGVRVVNHGGHAEDVLAADLVVDATGRGSRTPAWLAALGYEQPAEEEVVVDVRYESTLVRLAQGTVPETLVVIGASKDRPRGMGLFAYEDDTWMFTVNGYADHHPSMDYESMVDYVAGFAPPHMVEALRAAEPLGELSTFRFRANRRLRYDRLRRFPAGLLVLGDAMCSFNPIYGQGMSVAALEAMALRDSLRRGRDGLSRRFFRAAARPIEVAWRMAVGADLALPHVDGPRPLPVRMINAYIGRLIAAAEHDPVLAARFLRVSSFVLKPPMLMTPPIVARVLFGRRRSPAVAVPERVRAGMHGA
ncbi:MAG TPA: FAD-dependent monooxygenase [Actinophytocola sp.]|jgi:2-polyprenyl-6-methoxyphenol hydroxylase-like FAD-dependent oxidoreductase|nr:FAD-dependent monooxygenase [Actinophytocola sp.]